MIGAGGRVRAVMPATLLATMLGVISLVLVGCGAARSPTSGSGASARPSSVAAPLLNVDNLSAEELLNRAKLTAAAAGNLRIEGTGKDGGESLALDLSFSKAGSSGSITLDALPLTLLSRDGNTWFKGSASFWQALAGARAASVVALINGRWVKANPADRHYADFAGLADRDELLDQFLTPHGTVIKGGRADVNGVPCIALTRGAGQTLYVSTKDGLPMLLRGGTAAASNLTFAYAPVTIPDAPAASDVLDSAALGE